MKDSKFATRNFNYKNTQVYANSHSVNTSESRIKVDES